MSLVVEVTEPSAEDFKYLSHAQKDGDDGEGVHRAEEDGFFKMFRYHALGHVEGLLQRTGVTHEERVNLENATRNASEPAPGMKMQLTGPTRTSAWLDGPGPKPELPKRKQRLTWKPKR